VKEQQKQAADAAAKAKAEADKVAKAQADAQKKAEAEAKKQAEADAAAAAVAKKQAQAEAKKAAADAEKKAAAEEAKQAAAEAKAAEAKQAAEAKAAEAKEAAEAKAAAAKEAKAAAAKEAAAEKAAAAKAAADAKKKAAAAAAKQSADVDDLFGGLASSKNAPKGGGGAAGVGKNKKSGASGADISNYAGQVEAAIKSRFYDYQSYIGKTCSLRIKLAPNGTLLDIQSEGGDPALCQAAIAAARQARIPKPPSQDVYEVFKNAPVDFKPQ